MKIKRYYLKLLIIFCLMTGIKYTSAQCTSGFIIVSQGTNGQVTFSCLASPVNAASYFYWNFGNSQTLAGNGNSFASPNVTYAANGNYVAQLTYSNSTPPCALSTTSQTLFINSVTCSINASFNVSPGTVGTYSFISTTTGTNPATSYTWNYGDGSPLTYNIMGLHTYNSTGSYPVKLIAMNTGTSSCIDTTVINLAVPAVSCNLVAGYSAVPQPASGMATFSNTSNGITASTAYTLQYGDGSIPLTGTNFSTAISHIYNQNGTYISVLSLQNSPGCTSSTSRTVSITNIPCNLNANFTHTVGPPGLVNFSGTVTGTLFGTLDYYWDFGDGVYSILQSPAHAYSFAGAYDVTLLVKDTTTQCRDSITYALNITGMPCSANAGFNLSPSSVPQYWNAVPLFPWNVTTARWDWGDGTFSDSLYTSHNYAAAGTYSICLSVTVSCGATDYGCGSYAVFKTTNMQENMAIVHVNVKRPSLTNGIASFSGNDGAWSLYPNPNNGEFNLLAGNLKTDKANIHIYNLVGELVYAAESAVVNGAPLVIQPGLISGGVYFVNVRSGDQLFTKKIIVSKP